MIRAGILFIAVALVFSTQLASAQDLSRYRDYVLGSSVESVVEKAGMRATDTRTLHERPAKIQQLEWRAPFVSADKVQTDPVRIAVFAFCDNVMYEVVVSYDRGRTDRLTNKDIIESLVAVYGQPLPAASRRKPPEGFPDTIVLAQWDSPSSSVTLIRAFSEGYQLVLTSKAWSARARNAIREAVRLDAIEAPRRELEQRRNESADAAMARDRLCTADKDTFHP